jgi:phosphopantetheinyl transferase (holo-ACP synthase)
VPLSAWFPTCLVNQVTLGIVAPGQTGCQSGKLYTFCFDSAGLKVNPVLMHPELPSLLWQNTTLWWTSDFSQRGYLLSRAAECAGLPANTPAPHRQISLSHSKKWLVVASTPLSAGLGVDVEALRPLKLPHCLKFFAHPSEAHWWQNQPDPVCAAIQLWTQKEAAYKAYYRQDRNLTRLQISQQQTAAEIGPLSHAEITWQVSHPTETLTGIGITFPLTALDLVSVCLLQP